MHRECGGVYRVQSHTAIYDKLAGQTVSKQPWLGLARHTRECCLVKFRSNLIHASHACLVWVSLREGETQRQQATKQQHPHGAKCLPVCSNLKQTNNKKN